MLVHCMNYYWNSSTNEIETLPIFYIPDKIIRNNYQENFYPIPAYFHLQNITQKIRQHLMNIIILLTSRPTDNLRVLVLLRALMFDVHHSLRYVTLCMSILFEFYSLQFQRIFVPIQRKKFWGVFKKKKNIGAMEYQFCLWVPVVNKFFLLLCVFLCTFTLLELLESIFS